MASIGSVVNPSPVSVENEAPPSALGAPGAVTQKSDEVRPADTISPAQSATKPLLDQTTVGLLASPTSAPGDAPLADTSLTGKVSDSLGTALSQVARDGTGALADALKDPKKVALVTAGLGATIGAQFIPVAGQAVDAVVGVAGVAMYAAAGKEHRARIGQSLDEFKQYLTGVSSAKTQGELDAASGHLAKFLEIGGDEAVGGLMTVAGAAAAPAKFAGLLSKVKELGGFEGVVTAGAAALNDLGSTARSLASDAGELASRGWNAVKDAAASATGAVERAGRDAWQAAGRAVDTAGRTAEDGLSWLGRQLGLGGHDPALAGAGAAGNGAPDVSRLEMRAHAPTGSSGRVAFPRGSFDIDEQLGGHPESMHIGKDDAFLRRRMDHPAPNEPQNPLAASTFNSRGEAAKAIGDFLASKGDAVQSWLQHAGEGEFFSDTIQEPGGIGRVLRRGEDQSRPGTKVFVQLQRDQSERGFHIFTMYPKDPQR